MMMLLHGDHKGGAVILVLTRQWGSKSWNTIRQENLSHSSVDSAGQSLMNGFEVDQAYNRQNWSGTEPLLLLGSAHRHH
jgi:hypothetical protein